MGRGVAGKHTENHFKNPRLRTAAVDERKQSVNDRDSDFMQLINFTSGILIFLTHEIDSICLMIVFD